MTTPGRVTRQSCISFPAKKSLKPLRKSQCNRNSSPPKEERNFDEKLTPKRHPKYEASTPSSALSTLTIHSPKSSLQTSNTLPCRESEIEQLSKFLSSCLIQKKPGVMYVSGLPGTGKTAALTNLIESKEIKEICEVVMTNCMLVKTSAAIYRHIFEALNLKVKARTEKATISAIEKHLQRKKEDQKMILLVLDEIDELTSRFQTVLYSIFEWPSKENSRLILIGIANDMNLTERLLPRLQVLKLQPELLNFRPYTKDQIVTILRHQLSQSNNLFAPGTLELISAKVANKSGDLRRALDLGRRILETTLPRSAQKTKTISEQAIDDALSSFKESAKKNLCEVGFSSPRKRTYSKSEDSLHIPQKTPRKLDEAGLSKENSPLRRSSRKLSSLNSPCMKLITPQKVDEAKENSPLRKSARKLSSSNSSGRKPCKESPIQNINNSLVAKKSPRKQLFADDKEEFSVSSAMRFTHRQSDETYPSVISPRRSPRKSVVLSPSKLFATQARDIMSAFNQIGGSVYDMDFKNDFPLHQKLVICTLMLIITKGKNKGVSVGQLHDVYKRVCNRRGITAVNQSDFIAMCSQLEIAGGLQIGKGPARCAKVTLKWDEKETIHAMRDASLLTAIMSDTQVLSKKI